MSDNVSSFPISNEAFQRTLISLADKYLGHTMPPPNNAEKVLFDSIVQNRLFQNIDVEQAISEATKIIEARRELFK